MKKLITLIVLLIMTTGLVAQQNKNPQKPSSTDSLMNALGADSTQHQQILSAFKATRLIFSPTTETIRKNNLNFLILHRFGDIGTHEAGARTFWGLDAVKDVYIGFEYGINNNLTVTLGRSTIQYLIESQLKYALLHQSNDGGMPLNLTLQGGAGIRAYGSFPTSGDRWSYIAEAIISRKITSGFSMEVLPIFVQNNQPLPNEVGMPESFFALAAAARMKVTKHMSILVDYEHPFSSYQTTANQFYDPLGFGMEFETGGHVFTLNITNANAISQINSLSDSRQSYGKGQFRFGFTISRMFDFNHNKNRQW